MYPTCGYRDTEIDKATAPVVGLGAYGMKLHAVCVANLTAGQLPQLMGVDETRVRYPDGLVLRARDASCIQADGAVSGYQEPVPW